jgi:hypothetical protein
VCSVAESFPLFNFSLFTTLQTGFLIQQHVLWVMASHPKRAIGRKLEIEKDKSYLSLSVSSSALGGSTI